MTTDTAKKNSPSSSAPGNGAGQEAAENGVANPFAEAMSTWMSPNAFQSGNADNLSAMSEASGAAMKGAMGFFQETSRFMSERLKKDVETMQALSGCRTPEDFFRVQAEFFDTAIRDYSDETSKVAKLVAETTQGACEPLQDRTAAVLHKMQSKSSD
ncbi:MAG: phasin family protein [Pseudomonadota bacterium]